MAPRNFVILFREREGSSAIIDLLGKHALLRVPVFEHLDQYFAKDHCQYETIAQLAGLTLQTGDFDLACRLLKEGAAAGPPASRAVGLKWRIWGPAVPVVEMLRTQKVVVFHLFRLQLLELAASLIFTNTVIPALERDGAELHGGGHLQFQMAKMTAEQRAAFQLRLAEIRFRLDPERVVALAQDVVAFKRRMHETYLRPLQDAGVEVRSLVYEDFVGNRDGFLQAMCGVIGVDAAPLRSLEPMYRKVSRHALSSQIDNWAEVGRTPALRAIMSEYRQLITRDHVYLPPARLA